MTKRQLTPDQLVRLLHASSGHANLDTLFATFNPGANLGTKLTAELKAAFVRFAAEGCDICAASRMRRASIGPSRLAARTLDKGERGYFDVAGPMPIDSAEFGYKYGAMLVPEDRGCKFLGGSRYKMSEEMQDHLQHMQAALRPCIGTLYVIRFDNAKETRSDAMQRYLNSQGTAAEFSSPHVHEELGLVERVWQTIERTAVAALRHAPNNCSLDKWFDTMQYGVMIDIKTARARPRCDDLIISSEQRLTGKIPNYALFIPFYCPVRFFLDPEQRSAQRLQGQGRDVGGAARGGGAARSA